MVYSHITEAEFPQAELNFKNAQSSDEGSSELRQAERRIIAEWGGNCPAAPLRANHSLG